MKTEPNVYSIDDVKKQGVTPWEGIRNYQARNFMKNDMRIGDEVFIYHSNATPPGIVGLGSVASTPYPAHFAWDTKSPYFDPKSLKENPRWFMVDIKFKQKFSRLISLTELKEDPKLNQMMVTKKGSRLSIQPVLTDDFHYIIERYVHETN